VFNFVTDDAVAVDGYPMQDVVMEWRGDSLTEAVRGADFIEIPQFTLVQYRTITTVETLATGQSLSVSDTDNAPTTGLHSLAVGPYKRSPDS